MIALTLSAGLRYRGSAASFKPPEGDADGGAGRDRTGDLRLAKAALSQLSYSPNYDGGRCAAPDPMKGQLSVESGGPKWI